MLASSSVPIVGNAIFTTVASRNVRPDPSTVASRTQRALRVPQTTDSSAGIGAVMILAWRDARSSGRMNHLTCVRESHSVTAGVRNNDGARPFVGGMSRPVALKLKKDLDPTRQPSAGLSQPSKRELVAGQRQPATRICDDEHIESLVKRRESGKRHAAVSK